jgi:glucosamine--fructose-6-phosphate aminotransferase (isomerizing)
MGAGVSSGVGIAHTRWATHGKPAVMNAHPHCSRGVIGVVHNGIIENHEELKRDLISLGYVFNSQTDTEVIAHLVHLESVSRKCSLLEAVRRSVALLKGAYAIAVISQDEPDVVVCAKLGSPLIVAYGEGENFVASDALAISGKASRMSILEDGDIVLMRRESVEISGVDGVVRERPSLIVPDYVASADLGPHSHYMHKEIFEQTMAVASTLEGVEEVGPEAFGAGDARWSALDGVLILACGTSYYSSCVAKYWIEEIAGIPVTVEVASEYRYRKSIPNPDVLVVVVSQSGETADTLAALRHAKALGHTRTLAICNVGTSTMVREAGSSFMTNAGTEIGVASTKAFTTQLVALYLLAMTLAKARGQLSADAEHDGLLSLRHLPAAINSVLALEPEIKRWAEQFAQFDNAIFLGRGSHYPIALEGALKLKETSYIHAEAYPAGELKHGPLALITDKVPVVTVAPNDHLLEKLKSNMQEVRARGGLLYVFADADSHVSEGDGIRVIRLPENYGDLSPILHVIPLQLLAYHVACARGTDVDKPRNLAKSVTVE